MRRERSYVWAGNSIIADYGRICHLHFSAVSHYAIWTDEYMTGRYQATVPAQGLPGSVGVKGLYIWKNLRLRGYTE